MRHNPFRVRFLAAAAIALTISALPAEAWIRCYHDGPCTTCFLYSDDSNDTYRGYMSGCSV
jgi:hypothetical protein